MSKFNTNYIFKSGIKETIHDTMYRSVQMSDSLGEVNYIFQVNVYSLFMFVNACIYPINFNSQTLYHIEYNDSKTKNLLWTLQSS